MVSDELLARLDRWAEEGKILESARDNLRTWLASDRYADFHASIRDMIDGENLRELNDCFWTIIPFGTGGRRGTMGVGPNRINERTIGESAQGLADYIAAQGPAAKDAGCVIAHDTRNGSPEFARLVSEVLAASGIKVYFFDGFRSTPELSFAVRHLKATAGAMITASHNPPSDNGFKAYWNDGGQVVPPHDGAIIERVKSVGDIRRLAIQEAESAGLLVRIGREVDEAYLRRVGELSLSPERDVAFVYTPLHGTGTTCVTPALEGLGFTGMKVYEEQAFPDGGFPNVPEHKPNPEDSAAMEPAVRYAQSIDAPLVIASDPDADRLAVACRDRSGEWVYLSGNQVGVLLVYHTLSRLAARGELPQGGYIVRTLVTTMMVDKVAEGFGVEVVNDLLVGFKYVAETIRNAAEGRTFLFGFEESIGYLRADFVRDKDAAQAAVYVCELAAVLKARGKTFVDLLDELYEEYGYFREIQKSLYLEGAEGSRKMSAIMDGLRARPPAEIGGHEVALVIDRQAGQATDPRTGERRPVSGTRGNVLVYVLSNDGETRVSIRPSGTEPKIKHYIASSGRMEDGFSSLASLKTMVDQKVRDILEDLLEIEKELGGPETV